MNSDPERRFDVGAVLLAAGESRRMGTPKGLLPWAGMPLLQHQMDVLCRSCVSRIVVILGEGADDLDSLVPQDVRINTIWNARYKSGRSSSAIIGTVALGGCDALIYCDVDQPLSTALVNDLIRGATMDSSYAIAVATHRGKRGHPILIRRALFSEVISISEQSKGLKAVIRRDPARVLSVLTDSPNAHVGFNTTDEYELALQRLSRGELEAG